MLPTPFTLSDGMLPAIGTAYLMTWHVINDQDIALVASDCFSFHGVSSRQGYFIASLYEE